MKQLFTATSQKLSRLHKLVGLAFVGLLLTLCSFVVMSTHTQVQKATEFNCASSCDSHGQPIGLRDQAIQDEDDDLEPTPPASSMWLGQPVALSLLYLAPIIGIIYISQKQRDIHLSTQLRL